MKIQLIVEILVVLAIIAFAAGRVIDSRDDDFTSRLIQNMTKSTKDRQNEIVVGGPDYDDDLNSNVSGEISVGEEDLVNSNNNINNNNVVNSAISSEDNNLPDVTDLPVNVDDAHPLNRYCNCNEVECNCCREFKLPLVSVRGPGCATVRYLGKNRMSVAVKYGDITLTTRTISGRKARPICLTLPGGYSQFCGRVYGINREDEEFKACLGLELRAEDEVEAALRVSCFQFGPRGLKMTDPEPLPPVVDADEEGGGGGGGASDLLSLIGAGGSDEDDDDDEEGASDDDDDDLEDDDDDDDDSGPTASDDYTSGFSLLDDIFGSDSANKKKKPVQNRNKVITPAEEEIKANKVGSKVKIPNSQAILNSASLSQNEIDSNLSEGTKLEPEPAKPLVETPKPAEEAVKPASALETNLVEAPTTPKPKKKPSSSLLDTLESLIAGDDDDDDDDDEEDDVKDEAEDEKDDEEDDAADEEDEAEDDEDDDDDEAANDEVEDEKEDEDDEDDDEDDAEPSADKIKNDKQQTDSDKKKTKKKTDFGFGLLNFARLMKLIN